jgi:ribonuclease HI
MPFYGVRVGRIVGVFTNWKDVQNSIMGFPGAKFKKFDDEASAKAFCLGDTHFGDDVDADASSGEHWFNVYTDGSCVGNGTPRAIAGYGIYFGKDHPKNLSARVPDEYPQTNNTGELLGIIKALEIVKDEFDLDDTGGDDSHKIFNVRIYSDSEYAIRCATTYGRRCESQGWKKEIPNQELVKKLLGVIDELMGLGIKVDFVHILAHTGKQDEHSIGNDFADSLANMAVGLTASTGDDLLSYARQKLESEDAMNLKTVIPRDRKEFIDVKFEKKDAAKVLGARWDARERSWYIPQDCDPDFAKALRKLFK